MRIRSYATTLQAEERWEFGGRSYTAYVPLSCLRLLQPSSLLEKTILNLEHDGESGNMMASNMYMNVLSIFPSLRVFTKDTRKERPGAGVVAHAFNPSSTQEAQADRSAWSTERDPSQQVLHSETPSQKEGKKRKGKSSSLRTVMFKVWEFHLISNVKVI